MDIYAFYHTLNVSVLETIFCRFWTSFCLGKNSTLGDVESFFQNWPPKKLSREPTTTWWPAIHWIYGWRFHLDVGFQIFIPSPETNMAPENGWLEY